MSSHLRSRALSLGLALLVGVALSGCSEPAQPPAEGTPERAEAREPVVPPPPNDVSDERPAIIAFGDSLTAGFGLEIAEAWPSRLQETLDADGFAYRVVSAGVSGETTSGGLRRLPWVLDRAPDAELIVIALGGNDGLRGSPLFVMEDNLRAMIEEAEGRDLGVLLAGVPAPPELGKDYAAEFEAVFERVAGEAGVLLLPSILEGVAGVPELNQRDGIHPNVEGARHLAGNVYEALRPLLGEPATTDATGPGAGEPEDSRLVP